jgi:hypothetical protein
MKKNKFVDTVAKQVIDQIELVFSSGIKPRLKGMRVPGIVYHTNDDFHYFSYFQSIFKRDEGKWDDHEDWEDDEEFKRYLVKNYGFPKELIPQLKSRLIKWAKSVDPDVDNLSSMDLSESEDKTDKFYNLVIKNLLKKTQFYIDVVEKKGDEYNFIEVLLPSILAATMDGAGYDEMISDMMSHYGLQGEEEVKTVIDRYMDVVDKFMEEYDITLFSNDQLYKLSDYINE